jgi:hypothetical protein
MFSRFYRIGGEKPTKKMGSKAGFSGKVIRPRKSIPSRLQEHFL